MAEKCVATMNAFGYALGRDFVCHPALHELPTCVSDRERVRELCQHHVPVYVDVPSHDAPNAVRIVMTPDTLAGAARIDGTRVSVRAVLAALGGVSVRDVQKAYPQLTVQQIEAALDFATEFIETHAVAIPPAPDASTDAAGEAIAYTKDHLKCPTDGFRCVHPAFAGQHCPKFATIMRPLIAALIAAEKRAKEAENRIAFHHCKPPLGNPTREESMERQAGKILVAIDAPAGEDEVAGTNRLALPLASLHRDAPPEPANAQGSGAAERCTRCVNTRDVHPDGQGQGPVLVDHPFEPPPSPPRFTAEEARTFGAKHEASSRKCHSEDQEWYVRMAATLRHYAYLQDRGDALERAAERAANAWNADMNSRVTFNAMVELRSVLAQRAGKVK